MSNKLRLSEVFGPTLQGEGDNCGRLSYFIRFAGCDQNPACLWCDTLNSYGAGCGEEVDEIDIVCKLDELIGDAEPPRRIVITGGNPCIQNLDALIRMLRSTCPNVEICIETQGTVIPEWLYMVDHVTFSPKPPSSSAKKIGQATDAIKTFTEKCSNMPHAPASELKIVVFDVDDMKYAIDEFKKFEFCVDHFTFQVGTSMNSVGRDISADDIIKVILDKKNHFCSKFIQKVRVLPQLHRVLNVQ